MAQSEKRENSVLFSLRELRQIEESRVQEEEHAVRSAEEERRIAREAAEAKVRDAEESKIREERDHQRSIEESRVAAEREARMRVEAGEAAERQRNQAALEQQRLQQEMELRRAEVAKKRPTWMLAVTGFAIVAAIGLIFFAIQRKNAADEADKQAEIDRRAKEVAVKVAAEAQEKVEKIQHDLDDLTDKITNAVDAVATAQNDADRSSARQKLAQLQKEQMEMRQRAADAKAAAAKAERARGVHTSAECLANPLAKGCS
jgi:hypothetical protein